MRELNPQGHFWHVAFQERCSHHVCLIFQILKFVIFLIHCRPFRELKKTEYFFLHERPRPLDDIVIFSPTTGFEPVFPPGNGSIKLLVVFLKSKRTDRSRTYISSSKVERLTFSRQSKKTGFIYLFGGCSDQLSYS